MCYTFNKTKTDYLFVILVNNQTIKLIKDDQKMIIYEQIWFYAMDQSICSFQMWTVFRQESHKALHREAFCHTRLAKMKTPSESYGTLGEEYWILNDTGNVNILLNLSHCSLGQRKIEKRGDVQI